MLPSNIQLPSKNAPATQANARILENSLTSVIAGHAQAVNPWTFYEVIDGYLGPWGANGYPIGYGKKYCMLFSSNAKLRANPTTNAWVWRTTILLQEMLRDFIVSRFKAGTLGTLTEAELRRFAFDTHPLAYTRGGLTLVVIVDPLLTSEVALIPKAEYVPTSPSFIPTLRQVFVTGAIVGNQGTGTILATLAGPAHSGLLSYAAAKDQKELREELNLSEYLSNLKTMILHGMLDDPVVLDGVRNRLNCIQFPDQGLARMAREVIAIAQNRKQTLERRP